MKKFPVRKFVAIAVLSVVCLLSVNALAQSADAVSFGGELRAVSNAASYAPQDAIVRGSIAVGFGSYMTTAAPASAITQPLPRTLSGVEVWGYDGNGNEVRCQLFYVSAQQVNFVVAEQIVADSNGFTTITIATIATGQRVSRRVRVVATNPGVFSANSTGTGTPAAVSTFDAINYQTITAGGFIEAGYESHQNYLILFGTGIKGASQVKAFINGIECAVTYAGAQGDFAGLDQINIKLNPSLRGAGADARAGEGVPVVIVADGHQSNITLVRFAR